MPKTRRLLRGEEITYSVAKELESNVLHQLTYYEQQNRFFTHLSERREWIRTIVAHHLGLKSSAKCHWMIGMEVVSSSGFLFHTAWVKLLTLAIAMRKFDARHAWLQENCSDVPIPKLYGFALSSGETFTRFEYLPRFVRYFHIFRCRLLSWLGYPTPSSYVRHQHTGQLSSDVGGTGYLLLEYIEETQGKMLSETWIDGYHNVKLRANFFRGLSRILLSISRIPLPKIGSFIIDSNGFLCLSNRPLSAEIHQLENENIPTEMPRNYTYSTVDSYVLDELSIHDSRFRNQPNAVNDLGDCAYQLAALSAMRAVFPPFFRRDFRRGPFTFHLTDLHQSNIFVDSEWNITCLVDLEWACSRPIEMLMPPHWLTNKGIDQLETSEYDSIRTEFMGILTEEEKEHKLELATSGESHNAELSLYLSDIMNRTWETGTFWYTLALSSPSGLFRIFDEHIRPLFCSKYGEEFNLVMPFLWEKDIAYVVRSKICDKKQYDDELREAFED
ncbi:hypothetical protein DTO207G8_955 [Paecilomyces variotii]|nr:hypothetical protein DTO207G8_955 [Paecilomyces variotii]KAJ9409062.1 hypothetical protein DTO045G8_3237 [Paecilomyces variotii]